MSEALAALGRGVVVAAPTESFFGLLADVRNPRALDTLLSLKPRGHERGVGLILPGREAWSSLVLAIPELAEALADAFWPGPLTIALAARPEIDPRITVGGTLAVRDAGGSPARDLALALGRPLTATSANLPGEPPPVRSTDVERAFDASVRDGRLVVVPGDSPGGLPSTLVSIAGDRALLVRHGAVPLSALSDVLRPLGVDLDEARSSR